MAPYLFRLVIRWKTDARTPERTQAAVWFPCCGFKSNFCEMCTCLFISNIIVMFKYNIIYHCFIHYCESFITFSVNSNVFYHLSLKYIINFSLQKLVSYFDNEICIWSVLFFRDYWFFKIIFTLWFTMALNHCT